MRLVSELRRRNVFRMAVLYFVAAWLIIQVAEVLIDLAKLPDWIGTTTLWLLGIGFPIALIFSWFYEITPEGISFEKDVDPEGSITHVTGRRLDFIVISLLCAAVILFAYDKWWISGPPEQSIAVLPFQSRSTDPDNELFADGIHDDLLTRLANISSLKVISRTSVMEYRNTTKNLRQIATELGVGTVLEGAVQRVGDSVRINAQLIDAATDEHIWAKSYDRQLTAVNLFAIQSEISEEISRALRATLTNEEQSRLANIPTNSLAAYNLYTQGRDNVYKRRHDTLLKAREQFEGAIALDPDYADAYVALAESVLLLYTNHIALAWDEADELARANLNKAFQLNPDLADAFATQGLLEWLQWTQTRVGSGNLAAEAAYERAITLNPNHAQAHMWFASLRSDEGRTEDSIALYQRSMQLDPLGRIPYTNLPGLYAQLGQNDVALKLWLDAIEIFPDWPSPYVSIALHLFGMGRADEAYAWDLAVQELSTDPQFQNIVGLRVFIQFDDFDKARSILESMPAEHFLALLTPGLQFALDRNFVGALDFFSGILGEDVQAPPALFAIASDFALGAGDLEKARDYILRQNPILERDSELQIDRFNVRNIVKLAYIHLQNGNTARGNEMLTESLSVVDSLPRLGLFGQGIRDVQILALLGRKEDALMALQAAVDAGFRGSLPYENLVLEDDPLLDSIRDNIRFTEILGELKSLNDEMYTRVVEAETTGNWNDITALTNAK